ncbi:MAG: hypothetical protein Q4C25_09280, partial [Bacillota bacterium]|nr:hypothetical protein [Bacillota bacterium]
MKRRIYFSRKVVAIVLILAMLVTQSAVVFAETAGSDATTGTQQTEEPTKESQPSTEDEEVKDPTQEPTELKEEETKESTQEDETTGVVELEYIFIETPKLISPETQNVVVSLKNGGDDITDMTLISEDESGEESEWKTKKDEEGKFKFTKSFTADDKGIYTFTKLIYEIGTESYEIELSDLNFEPKFGVDKDYITGEEIGAVDGITATVDSFSKTKATNEI